MLKNLIGFVSLAALAFGACIMARTYAAPAPKTESIVLAGGCFWVQAFFHYTKGVTNASAGYAGGDANSAQFETISSGANGPC